MECWCAFFFLFSSCVMPGCVAVGYQHFVWLFHRMMGRAARRFPSGRMGHQAVTSHLGELTSSRFYKCMLSDHHVSEHRHWNFFYDFKLAVEMNDDCSSVCCRKLFNTVQCNSNVIGEYGVVI
jgi:hypothetical protein